MSNLECKIIPSLKVPQMEFCLKSPSLGLIVSFPIPILYSFAISSFLLASGLETHTVTFLTSMGDSNLIYKTIVSHLMLYIERYTLLIFNKNRTFYIVRILTCNQGDFSTADLKWFLETSPEIEFPGLNLAKSF